MDIAFRASRYDKGGDDYLNCPMDETTYNKFYEALLAAEKVQPKEFEKTPYFEACLPIEVMAERGRQTMQFGPLKPVGLDNPKDRPQALCRRAAPNGKCPPFLLQHCRFSNQTDLRRAETGLSYDSRA